MNGLNRTYSWAPYSVVTEAMCPTNPTEAAVLKDLCGRRFEADSLSGDRVQFSLSPSGRPFLAARVEQQDDHFVLQTEWSQGVPFFLTLIMLAFAGCGLLVLKADTYHAPILVSTIAFGVPLAMLAMTSLAPAIRHQQAFDDITALLATRAPY